MYKLTFLLVNLAVLSCAVPLPQHQFQGAPYGYGQVLEGPPGAAYPSAQGPTPWSADQRVPYGPSQSYEPFGQGAAVGPGPGQYPMGSPQYPVGNTIPQGTPQWQSEQPPFASQQRPGGNFGQPSQWPSQGVSTGPTQYPGGSYVPSQWSPEQIPIGSQNIPSVNGQGVPGGNPSSYNPPPQWAQQAPIGPPQYPGGNYVPQGPANQIPYGPSQQQFGVNNGQQGPVPQNMPGMYGQGVPGGNPGSYNPSQIPNGPQNIPGVYGQGVPGGNPGGYVPSQWSPEHIPAGSPQYPVGNYAPQGIAGPQNVPGIQGPGGNYGGYAPPQWQPEQGNAVYPGYSG